MTLAQREQIEQCKRALAHGATPADLRDMGFAEAAIRAAIADECPECGRAAPCTASGCPHPRAMRGRVE